MRKYTDADVSKLLEGMVISCPYEARQRSADAGERKDITEFSLLRAEPVTLSDHEQVLIRRGLAKFEFNNDSPDHVGRIKLVSAGRLYAPIVYLRVSFRVSYTIQVGHRVQKVRRDSDGNQTVYEETEYYPVTGVAADTVKFALEASNEKALGEYPRLAYFDSVTKPDPSKKGYVYARIGDSELARREREEMDHEIYRYVMFKLFRGQDVRGLNWAGPLTREAIEPAFVMMLKLVYDVDERRRRDALMNESNYREVAGKNRRGCFGAMLIGLVPLGSALGYALTHFS